MNVYSDDISRRLQPEKEGCHKQHRVGAGRSPSLLLQEQAPNETWWGGLKRNALVFSCHIMKLRNSLPQRIMGGKFKS